MAVKLKFGYHTLYNRICHIDEVSNGLKCNCTCLQCGLPLIANQGQRRRSHFKHAKESDCKGAQESALHKLAKFILAQSSELELPQFGKIEYSDVKLENPLDKYIIDAVAIYKNQPMYIEIKVTHGLEEDKQKYFETNSLRSIEIDLSKCLQMPFEEIRDQILNNSDNKRIVFWELEPTPKTKDKSSDFIPVLITILIFLFGIFLLIKGFIKNPRLPKNGSNSRNRKRRSKKRGGD